MPDAVQVPSPLAIDTHASAQEIADAEQSRYRSLAAWAYIAYLPSYLGMLRRSEIIQGFAAGATAPAGTSAGGLVGHDGGSPIGSWLMAPDLPAPSSASTLATVDCLRGTGVLQLDLLGPVVLTVPANPANRYYCVAALDAQLNNFSYIGPQWSGGMADNFLIVPPGWREMPPVWVRGVIQAPTNTVILHNRVRVAADRSDLDEVRRWRQGIRLTPLEQWGKPHPEPPRLDLTPYVHDDLRSISDPFEYFHLVGEYLADNPPSIPQISLDAMFHTIGVGAGARQPAGPRQRAAIVDGVGDAQRMIGGLASGGEYRNGWRVPDDTVGRATPYLLDAAVFQLTQPGGPSPHEMISYFADRDRDMHVLDGAGDNRYELTFAADALPPVRPPGFWSLTMYRSRDDLLVANPINRYAVRADTPGFQRGADGSITITIGADRDERSPSGNWLPAPHEAFRVGLRAYYPGAQALTGDWFPPGIRKVR